MRTGPHLPSLGAQSLAQRQGRWKLCQCSPNEWLSEHMMWGGRWMDGGLVASPVPGPPDCDPTELPPLLPAWL